MWPFITLPYMYLQHLWQDLSQVPVPKKEWIYVLFKFWNIYFTWMVVTTNEALREGFKIGKKSFWHDSVQQKTKQKQKIPFKKMFVT